MSSILKVNFAGLQLFEKSDHSCDCRCEEMKEILLWLPNFCEEVINNRESRNYELQYPRKRTYLSREQRSGAQKLSTILGQRERLSSRRKFEREIEPSEERG
ncbi:hypothetical protein RND81_03G064200 [Saponaria officinalis]|uniref:Uncharacterized protein n=1 Tax=Saponaria officinalis TaxID=3572 RepID=A0AAW1M3U2_SAPOF